LKSGTTGNRFSRAPLGEWERGVRFLEIRYDGERGVRFLEIRYDGQPIFKKLDPSPSLHQKDAASMLPKPPDEPVQAR